MAESGKQSIYVTVRPDLNRDLVDWSGLSRLICWNRNQTDDSVGQRLKKFNSHLNKENKIQKQIKVGEV